MGRLTRRDEACNDEERRVVVLVEENEMNSPSYGNLPLQQRGTEKGGGRVWVHRIEGGVVDLDDEFRGETDGGIGGRVGCWLEETIRWLGRGGEREDGSQLRLSWNEEKVEERREKEK